MKGSDLPKVSEEPSEDKLQQEPPKVLVRLLDWVGVAAWLRSLDVEDKVVELVEKERVPGGQLVHMTLDELKSDLGMTTLQAKRVIMSMDGLVSASFASLSVLPSFWKAAVTFAMLNDLMGLATTGKIVCARNCRSRSR